MQAIVLRACVILHILERVQSPLRVLHNQLVTITSSRLTDGVQLTTAEYQSHTNIIFAKMVWVMLDSAGSCFWTFSHSATLLWLCGFAARSPISLGYRKGQLSWGLVERCGEEKARKKKTQEDISTIWKLKANFSGFFWRSKWYAVSRVLSFEEVKRRQLPVWLHAECRLK